MHDVPVVAATVALSQQRVARSLARCTHSQATLDRSEWWLTASRAVIERRPPIRGGGDLPGDETKVRARLRALMNTGVLPRVQPNRVWIGPCQVTHPCAACDESIGPGETELEASPPAAGPIFLHRRCWNLWALEAALLEDGPTGL
jgi:hypothetical protein